MDRWALCNLECNEKIDYSRDDNSVHDVGDVSLVNVKVLPTLSLRARQDLKNWRSAFVKPFLKAKF
jgi:hypothetical protein